MMRRSTETRQPVFYHNTLLRYREQQTIAAHKETYFCIDTQQSPPSIHPSHKQLKRGFRSQHSSSSSSSSTCLPPARPASHPQTASVSQHSLLSISITVDLGPAQVSPSIQWYIESGLESGTCEPSQNSTYSRALISIAR